jgi:heme/copper-type cytochrome/quinol oxidase subunit 3
MKKIVLSTMLLAFATASFGQQDTASKPVLEQPDYLAKSKRQKTAAWVFLGTGVAIFTGGLIAHYNHANNPDDFEDAVTTAFGASDEMAIAGVGLIVAGGSIPFFILSSKNKKNAKAATVFIEMEKAQVLQGMVFNNQLFPAVGVKIHL